MGIAVAERARALVGTRFRLQGRSTEGMDCVGVVCAALEICPAEVRRKYRLRGHHLAELKQELGRLLRRVPARLARAGDVMLFEVAPRHFHLAVRTTAGMVHAHAGIGRVVETPGDPHWRPLAVYRKRTRTRSS